MTKIKYTMILFFLFFLCSMEIVLSSCADSPCCCNNIVGGQKRCYTSGACCRTGAWDEYWDETGCRDFNVWVEPKRIMLTLGTRTAVMLYIDNIGGYSDSYHVDYEITSVNPSLINVDLTGVQPTGSVGPVGPGELITTLPIITVLTATETWDVTFNVTSLGDPNMYRSASLTIMQSDYPLSLSEFGILGLIEILILVVTVYFINRMR